MRELLTRLKLVGLGVICFAAGDSLFLVPGLVAVLAIAGTASRGSSSRSAPRCSCARRCRSRRA